VHKVHGQLSRKEITSVAREDEEILYLHIIQPGEKFDIQPGRYAIDLIAWYGEHASHSFKPTWTSTLPGHWPGYWANYPLRVSEYDSLVLQSTQDAMRSFKNAMEYLSPNQEALDVLYAAWDERRRRAGLERVGRMMGYSPVRDGLREMGESLFEALRER
jgi:hypothetical protein